MANKNNSKKSSTPKKAKVARQKNVQATKQTGKVVQKKESARGESKNSQKNQAGMSNMQQKFGNRAVQRLVAQRKGGAGAFKLGESSSNKISREKGGGHAIEAVVQDKLNKSMGYDLSDVRVHTDEKADKLNKKVNAKAFTVGRDIFFRSGEYNPGTSDGQELLAHELTHVIDQSKGKVKSDGSGMTVHAPDDVHEKRADKVAKQIAIEEGNVKTEYVPGKGLETSKALQRQGGEEELEMKSLQRQGGEEELEMKSLQRQGGEEELEMKSLQRQGGEEELEMKSLQRQGGEEELEMKSLQRQEGEEEVQSKSNEK